MSVILTPTAARQLLTANQLQHYSLHYNSSKDTPATLPAHLRHPTSIPNKIKKLKTFACCGAAKVCCQPAALASLCSLTLKYNPDGYATNKDTNVTFK